MLSKVVTLKIYKKNPSQSKQFIFSYGIKNVNTCKEAYFKI